MWYVVVMQYSCARAQLFCVRMRPTAHARMLEATSGPTHSETVLPFPASQRRQQQPGSVGVQYTTTSVIFFRATWRSLHLCCC